MAKINIKQINLILTLKGLMHSIVPPRVLESSIFAVIRNWTIQGTALMHWTELSYRMVLEFILFLIVYACLDSTINIQLLYIFSFIFTHTLMWTFNGHFWALHISKKIRLVRNNPKRITRYLHKLEQRINNSPSVEGCILFGSLTRGKFHEFSDLDIVFSKKSGFVNALFAYTVGVNERAFAFIHRIPIELYFYDSEDFTNTEKGEIPLLIKDGKGRWRDKVPTSVWLSDYSFLAEGFFR